MLYCCSKAFSLDGNNFSCVDLLILFKNVLSLSVSISQPSIVEIWFHKKLLWLTGHTHISSWSTIISKVFQCSYIIQPTLHVSREWISDGISSADNVNKLVISIYYTLFYPPPKWNLFEQMEGSLCSSWFHVWYRKARKRVVLEKLLKTTWIAPC